MDVEKVDSSYSGILCPLLTTLFVGLKLTGQIDWSWWWVLSPIWIPFIIAVLTLVIIGLIFGLAYFIEKYV